MGGYSAFFVGVVVGLLVAAIFVERGEKHDIKVMTTLRVTMMISALIALGVAIFT
ncbi:hypothetical protein [Streptomyces sp. NPDC051677]|uniref:hypothetical protein n=1 Tax=Streptomyces sp. NPDC051677 TaxID=3365669 RepID=UPI0037CFDAC1